MSRAALASPTLKTLAAAVLVLGTVAFLGLVAPAQAAGKPCWEQVIDDWVADGRIDGVYSARCMQQARNHLPEDLRAYSNFEEAVDDALQNGGRTTQGVKGPSGGTTTTRNVTPAEVKRITKDAGRKKQEEPAAEGPIDEVLNASGPTSADSVPLPLIILTGLALVLLAAGAAGFTHRKLQARRAKR